MTHSRTDGKPSPLWRFFSSVKLTIALLILVALTSIVGTLVPQGRESMDFAQRLSPPVLGLFNFLDLFDMYHAVWFRVLMGLLALNLIVCSVDRFPGAWKRFRTLPKPDRRGPFEDLPPEQAFTVPVDYHHASRRIGDFVARRYKRVATKEGESAYHLYGEKGRYSHFGVYLVHLSVLVILAGALVGSFLGFEAAVNVAEGERVDRVWLRNEMAALKLGFQIELDEFHLEFYPNGTPKEYRSDLTFWIDSEAVHKASVRVNHPVQFGGVTLYQSSYGTIPEKTVGLRMTRGAGRASSHVVEAPVGKALPLPGGEGHFQVADIRADFMRMGPAVQVRVHPEDQEEVRFWVFQEEEQIRKRFPGIMDQFPQLNSAAFHPYHFSVEELKLRYYTGLQVNRDPGVPVVWVGCFLMVVGFLATFFCSHRKIWLRVTDQGDRSRVLVAGSATKNPVGLQRELDSLVADLKGK
jgi:cytochrome c biogenesis protein